LLVGSSGGHLAQLIRLRGWWEQHDRHWVTFDKPDARSALLDQDVTWAYQPTTRNLKNLIRNFFLARRVLRDYAPHVVISNGAGVAVPFFVLARRRKIATVYMEVYDRIDSRTLTGRLCAPFTDLFLLQWPEQRDLYPKGVFVGPLY
jgi:UDP-N-acetylglucosamine:LPS N-acetylglucosamine transferase